MAPGSSSSTSDTLLNITSEACTKSLGCPIKLVPTSSGGYSGGGGTQTSTVVDEFTGQKYFVKSASAASGGRRKMLCTEYLGVKEMANTNMIKVPMLVVYGEGG